MPCCVRQMTTSNAADIEMSEKVSLHAVEDAETNSGEEDKSWREKLAAILQCNKVQYTVIAFVVLDSVIVILELLLDMGIIELPENHPTNQTASLEGEQYSNITENHHIVHRSAPHVEYEIAVNETHANVSAHGNYTHTAHHGHTNKEIAEHVLHYASLTILTLFVIEVIAKVAAEGIHLLQHKMEVFDAIVVLVSFSIDVAFSFAHVSDAARDVAGFMVVLRMWRVTRIINGVIMSVKLEADKKLNAQKLLTKAAVDESTRLKDEINKLENEIILLKEKLKKDADPENPGEVSLNTVNNIK
ncbi:voltage-gated hydrogen channel 1-like [Gigantopelta aegis]|uniref:voltage-gated hydrogen channel 1-like n=1 Tax=Gigantopelta aegis TaxID=1735272 RepID=UPI001B889A84|nr:voltage-gated hydrogen channel 1-like [Gigantopelta aegis]